MVLGLLDGFDDGLVEPFMPDGAVVALDVGVLLGLTGLDVLDGNTVFRGPDQQLATDVFRAVVDPNGAWLAAPFDVDEDQKTVWETVFPTILSRLRMTRSAGREKSTSMPSPSRLKSSSPFSNRNARPSPSRSAMKSIDQVMLGASGTAKASGLSRFSRLRGLIRRFSSSSQ